MTGAARSRPASATTATPLPRAGGSCSAASSSRMIAGLAGHSDADVLTHAIIDALLGAAALGDIGEHFPDSDERYRDAHSLELLQTTVAMLTHRGMTILHVDATVVIERPHIAPVREEIRGVPGPGARDLGRTRQREGDARGRHGVRGSRGGRGRDGDRHGRALNRAPPPAREIASANLLCSATWAFPKLDVHNLPLGAADASLGIACTQGVNYIPGPVETPGNVMLCRSTALPRRAPTAAVPRPESASRGVPRAARLVRSCSCSTRRSSCRRVRRT